MATYRELWNDLVVTIPRLPPPHAQTLINRAWADIRDFRLWSFLVGTGYLVTPVVITSGLATTTLGSASVVFDTTAASALNAVVSADPPLFHAEVGIGRQFRIASSTSGTPGALYNIINWTNSTRTMTLDRPFAEPSTTDGYMVYKCRYQPSPSNGTASVDFLRYFVITNSAVGYTIRGRRLYFTQAQLNARDPQRGSTGDPYFWTAYLDDPSTGNIVHEAWPHPVSTRVLTTMFQKRGLDLSDTVSTPKTFPVDCLMERAYQLGCQWALSQVSVFSELQQTNWIAAAQFHEKSFKERLISAIRNDDEISPLIAFQQGRSMELLPPGGAFLQNHDVSSWGGGWE